MLLEGFRSKALVELSMHGFISVLEYWQSVRKAYNKAPTCLIALRCSCSAGSGEQREKQGLGIAG